jgi:hypothetical protein
MQDRELKLKIRTYEDSIKLLNYLDSVLETLKEQLVLATEGTTQGASGPRGYFPGALAGMLLLIEGVDNEIRITREKLLDIKAPNRELLRRMNRIAHGYNLNFAYTNPSVTGYMLWNDQVVSTAIDKAVCRILASKNSRISFKAHLGNSDYYFELFNSDNIEGSLSKTKGTPNVISVYVEKPFRDTSYVNDADLKTFESSIVYDESQTAKDIGVVGYSNYLACKTLTVLSLPKNCYSKIGHGMVLVISTHN